MDLPVIVSADELAPRLDDEELLIVDVGRLENYATQHLPGAIHLDYEHLVDGGRQVPGGYPGEVRIRTALSSLGLTAERHVVAYDAEGGGRASRLLWTLDVVGHEHFSLLDGGLGHWAERKHPLTFVIPRIRPTDYPTEIRRGFADKAYVLEHMADPQTKLWDTRSVGEFTGAQVFAARGGHIPGAAHLDWLDTMDAQRCIHPPETLKSMLRERGILPKLEIIVYCQTHHRSAHSYILLKHLGYDRVRGYAGAWSEWASAADTPVETD